MANGQKLKTFNPNNPPESAIQRQIKQLLEFNGFFVWKNHQSAISYKGVSDLTAIRNGETYWIEVKRPDGRQSKDQVKFQKDVEEHGGVYLIMRSFEEAEAFMEGVKR